MNNQDFKLLIHALNYKIICKITLNISSAGYILYNPTVHRLSKKQTTKSLF